MDGARAHRACGAPESCPAGAARADCAGDDHHRLGQVGVLVSGVAGLLICAGKMAVGHRNRATFAADGATGVPWVLGGLSLAAVAAALVGAFLR